jgi:hypothetical protein
VQDVSAESLCSFVGEVVEPRASILTDGWAGYAGLTALGHDHIGITQSAFPDPAHVLLPGPHRVACLVKRWLLGTYQGGVAKAQLPYYLDESRFDSTDAALTLVDSPSTDSSSRLRECA